MGKVITMPVQEDHVPVDHFAEQKAKDWLIDLLKNREVEITFEKRDGTMRVMECSLDPAFIPVVEKKTDRVKPVNPDLLSVIDTEIGQWRSLRWDSITNIKWGMPTTD